MKTPKIVFSIAFVVQVLFSACADRVDVGIYLSNNKAIGNITEASVHLDDKLIFSGEIKSTRAVPNYYETALSLERRAYKLRARLGTYMYEEVITIDTGSIYLIDLIESNRGSDTVVIIQLPIGASIY